ncbi:MAG TPA: hypothetical protein VMT56_00485 [Candidatus Bathyarchaeia archaeon]|nr:hypothetical protein [Candidatus Bathyarchaeia archaeon]
MLTKSELLLALLSQHAAAYPEAPLDVERLVKEQRAKQARRNIEAARKHLAAVLETP